MTAWTLLCTHWSFILFTFCKWEWNSDTRLWTETICCLSNSTHSLQATLTDKTWIVNTPTCELGLPPQVHVINGPSSLLSLAVALFGCSWRRRSVEVLSIAQLRKQPPVFLANPSDVVDIIVGHPMRFIGQCLKNRLWLSNDSNAGSNPNQPNFAHVIFSGRRVLLDCTFDHKYQARIHVRM